MSTKIYDAYKISNFKSVLQMNNYFNKIREVVKHSMKKEYYKIVAENFIHKYDMSFINKKIKKPNLTEVYLNIIKKNNEIKQTQRRNPLYDFDFEIIVIPKKNFMLLKLFSEKHDLKSKIVKQFKMEDFHYQNQTDKPKDISAIDWTKRRKIWDSIFDKVFSFSDVGFSYQMNYKLSFITFKDIQPFFPTYKKRLRNIAYQIMLENFTIKFINKIKQKPDTQHYTSAYFKFRDYIITKHGQSMLKRKMKNLEKKIPKKIIQG